MVENRTSFVIAGNILQQVESGPVLINFLRLKKIYIAFLIDIRCTQSKIFQYLYRLKLLYHER